MLSAWNSFYVMIGSSAAALTGLMFVVITLVRENDRKTSDVGVSTFSTPTVVHFSCALFSSALMSAPFPSLVPIAVIFGLAGVVGIVYVVLIAVRTSKLTSYRADAEDWTWHVILPCAAYATFIAGAIAMPTNPAAALYAPAAAVVLLLLIGIHNAWDVVTFLATGQAEALPDASDADVSKTPEETTATQAR